MSDATLAHAVLSAEDDHLVQNIYKFEKPKVGVTKKEEKIEGVSPEDLSKGEFDTFMEKEIFEQPAATRTTILGRYDKKTGDAVLGGLID